MQYVDWVCNENNIGKIKKPDIEIEYNTNQCSDTFNLYIELNDMKNEIYIRSNIMSELIKCTKERKNQREGIAGVESFAGVQLGNEQLHHGCAVSQ